MEPKPVADFLKGILQQVGTGKSRQSYASALETILGAELAEHCQVLSSRKGRLVVEVDSAPLYAELTGFRSEEIRTRINELHPELSIAELTFRLGGTGSA